VRKFTVPSVGLPMFPVAYAEQQADDSNANILPHPYSTRT